MTTCRILNGMWQLSGAHGFRPELDPALQAMGRLVDKGYTTFDLADHYGPAEDFVGEFETRRQLQANKGQVHYLIVSKVVSRGRLYRRFQTDF